MTLYFSLQPFVSMFVLSSALLKGGGGLVQLRDVSAHISLRSSLKLTRTEHFRSV